MNFLRLLPLRDWMAVAAIALGLAVMGYGFHHQRVVGQREVQTKWDAERVRVQAVADKARADNQAETARRVAAEKEIAYEAQRLAVRAVADAADARDAGRRLLDRVAAAGGSAAAGHPAAAAGGASAPDAGPVQPDLLERVVEAAGQLAAVADQRGIAGQACERSYGALNPSPTP